VSAEEPYTDFEDLMEVTLFKYGWESSYEYGRRMLSTFSKEQTHYLYIYYKRHNKTLRETEKKLDFDPEEYKETELFKHFDQNPFTEATEVVSPLMQPQIAERHSPIKVVSKPA